MILAHAFPSHFRVSSITLAFPFPYHIRIGGPPLALIFPSHFRVSSIMLAFPFPYHIRIGSTITACPFPFALSIRSIVLAPMVSPANRTLPTSPPLAAVPSVILAAFPALDAVPSGYAKMPLHR